jgi:exosome complex RNA-binding protein Rrp42 (RNase PH superfamily)
MRTGWHACSPSAVQQLHASRPFERHPKTTIVSINCSLAIMSSMASGEVAFLVGGIAADYRLDGRSRLQYRSAKFSRCIIPSANGSVSVQFDSTRVCVALKLEISQPSLEQPDLGKVVCSVECPSACSSEFEGRAGEDCAAVLTSHLSSILSGCSALRRELSLKEGAQCWCLSIDVTVLSHGGNLLDACLFATSIALRDLSVPKISLLSHDSTGNTEIFLDDPNDSGALLPAQVLDNVPLCVSICTVGQLLFADPTAQEELCCDARIIVAFLRSGEVSTVYKSGRGAVAESVMADVLGIARQVCLSRFQALDLASSELAFIQKADAGLTICRSPFLQMS